MAKIILAIFVTLLSISHSYCFAQCASQVFNPNEIQNLKILPMNFGLRSGNSLEITKEFGKTYIAVKYRNEFYLDPNTKHNEQIIDYYYIFSEKKSSKTVWGLVTQKCIFSSKGSIIKNIVVPTDDKLIGLSSDVSLHPLSISFVAIEKSTNKAYVTETYELIGFDLENKSISIAKMDY